jgi:hypothetical protein
MRGGENEADSWRALAMGRTYCTVLVLGAKRRRRNMKQSSLFRPPGIELLIGMKIRVGTMRREWWR